MRFKLFFYEERYGERDYIVPVWCDLSGVVVEEAWEPRSRNADKDHKYLKVTVDGKEYSRVETSFRTRIPDDILRSGRNHHFEDGKYLWEEPVSVFYMELPEKTEDLYNMLREHGSMEINWEDMTIYFEIWAGYRQWLKEKVE